MIHPSYKEMIEKINETAEPGDLDISNRYSLVLATAKRARQINAGSEPLVAARAKEKNLSVAVEEFYAGKVHVLEEGEDLYEEDFEAVYDGDGYGALSDAGEDYSEEEDYGEDYDDAAEGDAPLQ